mmetsp:Transcript_9850/g.26772  ORF Transcript_9850/g.26772 Transcript_9850/m.26772 type:complete len:499 (+) Transcript_9850:123-1619(+)
MSDLDAIYEQRLMASPRRPVSENNCPGGGGAQSPARGAISPARTSPAHKRDVISDRFIPSRGGANLQASFALLPDEQTRAARASSSRVAEADGTVKEDTGLDTYSLLLKSELLGCDAMVKDKSDDKTPASPQKNLFRFKSSRPGRDENAPYSRSPVGMDSQRLLGSPRKTPRKISTVPYKVLDAPALQDDFYLNLVDWSSLNVLAVGLGACVYLWSACTSKVTKLCDLALEEDNVTSVSWTGRGTHLAVGTHKGEVQIWDASKCQKMRSMMGHQARVGTLSWSGNMLSSGSRDRSILQHDVRVPEQYVAKLSGHRQEVCGLKWSSDGQQLASGGNDNKLFVWNMHSTSPVLRFNDHTAAVKAIAWSPHQNGLLASGGGTADRCIRFWNTTTSAALNCVDTGSQVCNLSWSKNINELVSTHGYSQNQIVVWRYPNMSKVVTLTGHTLRVLYLALSPDSQTIVTGAGDETLRFWNIFPGPKTKGDSGDSSSLLDFSSRIR